MKMHWIYLLHVLLCYLCFTSCQNSQTAQLLNLAEDNLWKRPDSTLLILEQIPSPNKLEGKELADYALLLTQAQYRSNIIAPSDSLINIAINYYKNTNDADRIGACHLYRGGILSELNQTEQAMLAYKQAEKYIPQMQDKHLISRIYDHLGFLNYQSGNYDLAKKNHVKSLCINKQAGDTASMVNDLINLGGVYLFLNQKDSATWCSTQLLELVSKVDSNLQTKIYHNIAVEKMQQGNLWDAEKYLTKLKTITHGKLSQKSLSVWGKLYFEMGHEEKVDSLLLNALQTTDLELKASIYATLYKKAEKETEYQKEAEYLKKYIDIIDSIFNEEKSSEIRKLQLKYDHTVSAQQNAELRSNWYLTILIAVGLLISLLCIYYRSKQIYQKWKSKEILTHKQEVIRFQTRIDELGLKIEESEDIHNKEKEEIEEEIFTLQKEKENKEIRIKQLETMFHAKNLAIATADAESLQIFLKIKEKKEYSPAAERDKLHHWIDIACQNFATRLDNQCLTLTEREKDICYLSVLDFTIEEIAQLLNVQSRSIERYISRICEKLGFSKGSQEDFIAYIRDFSHQQEENG